MLILPGSPLNLSTPEMLLRRLLPTLITKIRCGASLFMLQLSCPRRQVLFQNHGPASKTSSPGGGGGGGQHKPCTS
eukprot:1148103-Pelagomonas_calceolata.AAC.2